MWNTHKMELFLTAKKNEIMIVTGNENTMFFLLYMDLRRGEPVKQGVGKARKDSERGNNNKV